jgi:hypothetical protein
MFIKKKLLELRLCYSNKVIIVSEEMSLVANTCTGPGISTRGNKNLGN